MAKAEGRKKSGMILAGDVGGTKCNLALFQEDSNRTRLQLIFQRRYPTQDYAARSFQSMLQDFLGHAAKSRSVNERARDPDGGSRAPVRGGLESNIDAGPR